MKSSTIDSFIDQGEFSMFKAEAVSDSPDSMAFWNSTPYVQYKSGDAHGWNLSVGCLD